MTKTLLFFPHWLGDSILATSLLRACIEENMASKITVACRPDFVDLISGCPQIEQCIPIIRQSNGRHWLSLWSKVWNNVWDRVIDLRGSGIGYTLWAKERKTWHRSPIEEHRVIQYQRFLGTSKPYDPKLWIAEDVLNRAEMIRQERRLIVIAPTANSSHKEWGQDHFQQLVLKMFSSEMFTGHTLLVVGTQQERPRVARFLDFLKNQKSVSMIDAVGGYSVGLLAAFFSKARFFLGNDSGPMHLAAALNVPTIGLFGPTSEKVYGPWGSQTWVIRAPEPTTRLTSSITRTMKDLRVPYVFEQIKGIRGLLKEDPLP